MARSSFWNKKRISEAKHYPTGIRRYCDKHGVDFGSYQSYCWRHNISTESFVTDNRGNAKFTFELFQQALQSPSPTVFCREHNLSYTTFYNYRRYGFPSSDIKKADLEPVELTADDMNVFGDSEVVSVSETPESELVDVEVVNTKSGARKPYGFWSLERIQTAKNYEGGLEKFCEDNNITMKAYRTACDRLGVSASVKHDERISRKGSEKKTRRYFGKKDKFWSLEKIAEAKAYEGGLEKFCEDNGVTLKAYRMACYIRGVDYHIGNEPCTRKVKKVTTTKLENLKFQSNGNLPRGFWSIERIEEALSFEGGPDAFCKYYGITLRTYQKAYERFKYHFEPETVKTALPVEPDIEKENTNMEPVTNMEPATTTKPYLEVNVFDKVRCSVIIKFKDGKVKELKAPEAGKVCFVLPSEMEIETLEFTGKGSISFI